jgi:hypothetical protein
MSIAFAPFLEPLWGDDMRRLIIAGTAAVLLTGPAFACEHNAADVSAAQVAAIPVVSVELSAATDKNKKKVVKKKKEKVEYMRSAAGPEPKATTPKKKKKKKKTQ